MMLPARYRFFLAFIFTALGLWVSCLYSFDGTTADGDTAHAAILWIGIREHGWAFVRSWSFTEDNWLLTVMPLSFAAYSVFGDSPTVVFTFGWLIAIGCFAMTALIAWRFVSRGAAQAMLPMFLFSGAAVFGPLALLAHPVSHGSSLLFGLVALYGALVWLQSRNPLGLVMCLLPGFMAGFSDPWAVGAMLAPMGVAAAGLALASKPRRDMLMLAATIFLSAVLVKLKPFGLGKLVPGSKFTAAGLSLDGVIDNLLWSARALTALFNIYPGADSVTTGMTILSSAVLGGLFLTASWALFRAGRQLTPQARFLGAVAFLSCGAIVFAYAIGPIHQQSVLIARFYVNIYVMLPLLVSLAMSVAGANMPRLVRQLAWGGAMLLALSGAISNPSALLRFSPRINTDDVRSLTTFLQEHGLRYGYGPYWGSLANAVTWFTQGAVTIRPVAFSRSDGHVFQRGVQSSKLWYRAEDVPVGLDRSFIVVAEPDDECPDIKLCHTAVMTQFGPAAETLIFGRRTIYVWNHPLEVR